MENKFLDRNGVQFLWKQLSLEDYPNNETLAAILNAIDDTKADKTYVNNYLLNIDYDTLLKFDTNEIVINNTINTTSVLGQAILGQMVLA
jgi:hypothetical protein